MLKAREKSAVEVRLHLCAWCLCVDVHFLDFLGSLQFYPAANHPGLRLRSCFPPSRDEMSTESTFLSAEASSLQPFCRQPRAAALRASLGVLILSCQNIALGVLC